VIQVGIGLDTQKATGHGQTIPSVISIHMKKWR